MKHADQTWNTRAKGVVAVAVAVLLLHASSANADYVTGNLVQNHSSELAPSGGNIPFWIEVTANWTRRNSNPSAQHGSWYFYAGTGNFHELGQEVDVSAWATEIDQGRVYVRGRDWVRSGEQGTPPNDISRFIFQLRNSGNSVLSTYTSPWNSSSSAWLLYENVRAAPAGTDNVWVRLQTDRVTGTENNGYHDNVQVHLSVGPLLTLQAGAVFPDAFPGSSSSTIDLDDVSNRGEIRMTEGSPSEHYTGVSREVVQELLLDGIGGSPQSEIALANVLSSQPFTSPAGEDTLYVGVDRAALLPDQVPGTYLGLVRVRYSDTHLGMQSQSNWVEIPVTLEVLPCTSIVLYVDADAPPGGDGMSWASAFNSPQDALSPDICIGSPAGTEIRIAQGTYTPHASDRNASFEIAANMTVRGGYAGFGEPDPNAWDPDVYVTILSGDLNGDDFARGTRGVMNGENSYHVVEISDITGVVIEGVTISGGNANGVGVPTNQGGGLWVANSGPLGALTLNEVHFVGNHASNIGGGIFHQRAIIATDCTFTANTADGNGGAVDGLGYTSPVSVWDTCIFAGNSATGFGGAISFADDNDFISCLFDSNTTAVSSGGALAIWSAGTVVNLDGCQFLSNSAAHEGGGIWIFGASVTASNGTLFDLNTAGSHAGAAYAHPGSTLILDSCTISNNSNTSSHGGALGGDNATINILNSTFTGNSTTGSGGALYAHECDVLVESSFFGSNFADGNGSAVYTTASDADFINTAMSGNTVDDFGIAFVDDGVGSADVTFTNCTIASNTSLTLSPAGIYNAGAVLTVENSILWGNGDGDLIDNLYGAVTAHNSCIQSWDGVLGGSSNGNHGANPLFLDPDGPDDTLGTLDDDYRLDHRSLCIDFGDDASVPAPLTEDILGNPRIVNCVDIGAIEHDGVSTDMIDFGCDSNSTVACFSGTGSLPGGSSSTFAAVDSTGQYFAGESNAGGGLGSLSIWTVGGIADAEAGFFGDAHAISDKGGTIVGQLNTSQRGFLWSACDGAVILPDVAGGLEFGSADGVSDDGTIAVGIGNDSNGSIAVQWVNGGPPTVLGELPGGAYLSQAFACSGDGNVIVGYSDGADGLEAVSWTNLGPPLPLGDILGGSFGSEAYAVSDDGLTIVGYSMGPNGREACVFDPTGFTEPVGLGDLPGGFFDSEALAVSADGRVIVGRGETDSGNRAFFYTEWTGMLRLSDLLEQHYGLDLTGWSLLRAKGLSADGHTIVGEGLSPSSPTLQGFVVHLPQLPPCPADVVPAPQGDGVINLFDLLLLLDNWGTSGAGADISDEGGGNTVVDLFDLLDMLDAWGGCPGP